MSLIATLMQDFRSDYGGRMDKNELRQSVYGVWDFFQDQSNLGLGLFTPAQKAFAAQSFGKTMQIPVYNSENITISNVRSCTIAPAENTTALVTLTWATYAFGFTMIPSQYFNNDIGYQQDFNKKMNDRILKFASTLDSAGASKLNNDRDVFFPASVTSYYPNVGSALQVESGAEQEDFFNQLDAIMAERDYYGPINIIGSTRLRPFLNRLRAQGAGNDTNEAFQFSNQRWSFSNRITSGAGVSATLFAVPDGNVATLSRIDPDCILGHRIGDAKIWGTERLPVVDLEVGTYYTADCSDQSALTAGTTGLTRTLTQGFEFSVDICFATSYNSNTATQHSPILKAEFLNPVVAP